MRISELGQNITGLYVQVDVPEVRENTQDDYAHQGQYGRIHGSEFNFIPVDVDLESGKKKGFWRHSLVVVDSFICVECKAWFRGVDYICDECRD